jgi:hypothetical protein
MVEEHNYPGSIADSGGERARILQANAEAATGIRPMPMSSFAESGSRYWRCESVPAVSMITPPSSWGAPTSM